MSAFVSAVNGILWSYVLIGLLIASGVYYTLRGKGMQFKLFGDMFRLITGKLSSLGDNEEKHKNSISGFQAFCVSVASHVGTGNLAGVAIAVAIGGPGALFWMWLIALLGSATSMIENTLAQIYKVKTKDGFCGGPAYYIEKALGYRGLGILFSFIVIVTFGFIFNTVQANTIAQALEGSFGLNTKIGGILIAALTAVVVFGGINRIARVSSVIVPLMALAYVAIAIVVLLINITQLPSLFVLIIKSAFGLTQAAGGAVGIAILQGVKRGLYSNEAGMGSAPNAAATSHVSHPVKQGLMQAFGVFIDTVVICSATGFIVLLLPHYEELNVAGIKLTQIALATQVGDWGNYFITFSIFLFAFSSIIGNYYYGEANLEFLKGNNAALFGYRAIVVAVIYLGCIMSLGLVWDMADMFMGIMALINISAIALLSPKAFAVIKDYLAQRKENKNPVYNASSTPSITNTECWS